MWFETYPKFQEFHGPKLQGVYGVLNTEVPRVYIGESKDVLDRLWQHISTMHNGSHDVPAMSYDYERYGLGSFNFGLFERHKVKENRLRIEKEVTNEVARKYGKKFLYSCTHLDSRLECRDRCAGKLEADIVYWYQFYMQNCKLDRYEAAMIINDRFNLDLHPSYCEELETKWGEMTMEKLHFSHYQRIKDLKEKDSQLLETERFFWVPDKSKPISRRPVKRISSWDTFSSEEI